MLNKCGADDERLAYRLGWIKPSPENKKNLQKPKALGLLGILMGFWLGSGWEQSLRKNWVLVFKKCWFCCMDKTRVFCVYPSNRKRRKIFSPNRTACKTTNPNNCHCEMFLSQARARQAYWSIEVKEVVKQVKNNILKEICDNYF